MAHRDRGAAASAGISERWRPFRPSAASLVSPAQPFVVVVALTVVLGRVVTEVVGFFVVVVVVLFVDLVVVVADEVEPDRLAHVAGPTMPSACNPLAFWNDTTAACVLEPNWPSALTLNPCAASSVWIWLTPGPLSPSVTLSLGLLTTRPPAVAVVDVLDADVVAGDWSVGVVDVDGMVAVVATVAGAIVAKVVPDVLTVVVDAVDVPALQPATKIRASPYSAVVTWRR